jgi:hypothetical protein
MMMMQHLRTQLAFQQLPSHSISAVLGPVPQALQHLHTLQQQMAAAELMQAQLQPLLRLPQNSMQVQARLQQMQAQIQTLQQHVQTTAAAGGVVGGSIPTAVAATMVATSAVLQHATQQFTQHWYVTVVVPAVPHPRQTPLSSSTAAVTVQ